MANSNSPFGFLPIGTSSGMPNFRVSTKKIASGNATPIYKGDPVEWVTNTPTGYITQAAPADIPGSYNNTIAGIFWGCTYLSTSQKRTVWSPYWPGADTAYDVTAYVIDDPQARFKVMGNSTNFNIGGTASAWTTSPIGQLCTFVIGTGSATTGLSGAYASTPSTTGEFMVIDLVTDPPGANGTDINSAYNQIIVGFSSEWLRSNASTTGIS